MAARRVGCSAVYLTGTSRSRLTVDSSRQSVGLLTPVHIPGMNSVQIARVSAGIPTGGQFSTARRGEPDLTLDDDHADAVVNVRSEPLKNMAARELGRTIREEMAAAHPDGIAIARQIDTAILLAEHLHSDQRRSNPTITTAGAALTGSEAYVVHPLRNALRVIRWGETDPDTVTATILHDAVEDQAEKMIKGKGLPIPVSKHERRRMALAVLTADFNSQVSHIVGRLSNPITEPGLTKQQKREAYRAHVAPAVAEYPVFMAKAADFVDNALGLHHQQGRPEMVGHLAQKYLPLCSVFTDATRLHQVAGCRLHPDLLGKLAGAEPYLRSLLP